jgi:hypothetical protein
MADLEERAKPRMIATPADFVVCVPNGGKELWKRLRSIQFWRKAFGDLLSIAMEGLFYRNTPQQSCGDKVHKIRLGN